MRTIILFALMGSSMTFASPDPSDLLRTFNDTKGSVELRDELLESQSEFFSEIYDKDSSELSNSEKVLRFFEIERRYRVENPDTDINTIPEFFLEIREKATDTTPGIRRLIQYDYTRGEIVSVFNNSSPSRLLKFYNSTKLAVVRLGNDNSIFLDYRSRLLEKGLYSSRYKQIFIEYLSELRNDAERIDALSDEIRGLMVTSIGTDTEKQKKERDDWIVELRGRLQVLKELSN